MVLLAKAGCFLIIHELGLVFLLSSHHPPSRPPWQTAPLTDGSKWTTLIREFSIRVNGFRTRTLRPAGSKRVATLTKELRGEPTARAFCRFDIKVCLFSSLRLSALGVFTFHWLTRSSAFRRRRCGYLGTCEPIADFCDHDTVHGRRCGRTQRTYLDKSEGVVPTLRYAHALDRPTQCGPQHHVNRWDGCMGRYNCTLQHGRLRLDRTTQPDSTQLSSDEISWSRMG